MQYEGKRERKTVGERGIDRDAVKERERDGEMARE